jgi:REP element-mobilizing transposase RayT
MHGRAFLQIGKIEKMADKFSNKYRIESNRLKGWDYSANGYYFITIVTAGRECIFGKIENKMMILSEFGKIANDEWFKSFQIRKELKLDEFIIMPNHLHAIVVIDGNDARPCIATIPELSSKIFQRKPKSISSFVAGYKSAVINKIDDWLDNIVNTDGRPYLHGRPYQRKYNKKNPLWQSNYHDHIIRNDESYRKIKNYIRTNPKKWDDDKFNTDNK